MATAIVALAFMIGMTACNSDPNAAKKRYLAMGDKYFDRGNYKSADIMYRRAIEKDKMYGQAYYKLALTYLKEGNLTPAVADFRRAMDLLSKDNPSHWDALIKLTDIYLVAAHDPQHMKEAGEYIGVLLAHDPNDFDAHRMHGDLLYIRAIEAGERAEHEEAKKNMDAAVVEYKTADSIKPGQQGIVMQLANCAVLEGDAPTAEKRYLEVIDRYKTFEQPYNELYKLYMFQGKRDDAEKLLKRAFENNPKNYSFLTSLAMHYSLENRRPEMLAVLQQIKSHAKEFPTAYQVVGDFFLRLGDADSAIREYNEGMAKDSAHKITYQKDVISVLVAQHKRDEAAEINKQILKDNPKDGDARSLEAGFLLDKGDVARALSELQAVVAQSPDNPVAHFQLGRAYLAAGESEQARQALQKAIELQPRYTLARLTLAQLLVTRGDFDAALKAAAEVLRIDHANQQAELIQSAALLGQRKYVESRALLADMLKKNPVSADAYFQLGVVNLAESKYKEANDAFQRTYALTPANTRGLMGMVETYMAEKKPDEAIKLLETEAAKSPVRLDVLLALGNTQVRVGSYDLALGNFQRVMNSLDKTSKTRGEVLLRIGETYRRQGNLEGAIGALQEARKILPNNPVILSTLALVLDTAGQFTQANQVYAATLKMNPNDAVSLNNLAFLMAEHGGDLDQALTFAQRAKQMLPDLPEVSDTLGWIYLQKHLTGDAVDTFKNLVNKVPTSSTYRYHLARAYFQLGDKSRATGQLELALKYSPPPTERAQIQALLLKSQ